MEDVLCLGPTKEQNDKEKLYVDYILNVKPYYIPNYKIKAIVTARLEKYRQPTEEWLKRHGVEYESLYMLDPSLQAEQLRLSAHVVFKSQIYSNLTNTFLFFESNPNQAKEITEFAKKPVICTRNDKLYSYQGEVWNVQQEIDPPG